jgi:hypothetical protein
MICPRAGIPNPIVGSCERLQSIQELALERTDAIPRLGERTRRGLSLAPSIEACVRWRPGPLHFQAELSALRPLERTDNNLAHFNKTIGRTRAIGGNTMLTTAFIILDPWPFDIRDGGPLRDPTN